MSTQLDELKKGTTAVIPEEDFKKKLETGKPLRIKLGMDPTAPDLHLGHAVVLRKMRQFQDMGHTVIFLIGDYTALIGDPSGKSKTRPPLTKEEIISNTKTYFEQVGRVLDKDKIEVRYNSEWLSKMSCTDILALLSKVTVARIIERDDFAKRLKEGVPVGMHELLYPMMQGYDSVVLDADVELGGNDQTFNLLMGRFLQEQHNQKPQAIITVPLLEGLDGVEKMSKSLNNYVGLTDSPEQAFGKLMSISDTLMWRYFEVLLLKSEEEIIALKSQHPMETKKQMAQEIVTTFWSAEGGIKARAQFEDVFQKGDLSKAKQVSLPKDFANPVWIVELLKALGAINSSSEAKRLLQAGSIQIDGNVVKEFKEEVSWKVGSTIKVGKHRIYVIS